MLVGIATLGAALLTGTLASGADASTTSSVGTLADPLLSRGKPTTASSSGGCCAPANAVDGSSTTRWASGAGSDPQWLRVDLGVSANISRVRLQWDLSCAKSYRIETSPNGSTWTSIFSTTVGDGGVDDLSLTGSGRFVRMFGTVRCRADSSHGYSLQELDVFGTTGAGDNTPPTPPTNLRRGAVTCHTATISWDAATDNVGVVRYDLFRDGQFVRSTPANTRTATAEGLTENVSYGFYVQAADAAGNVSEASDTLNVTTPTCQVDPTPPSAPTNAKATVSGTCITMTWTASTDNVGVTGYEVVDTDAGNAVVGTSTTTSAQVCGLLPNHTYHLAVRAKDAAGNMSALSNVVTARTGGDCTNPVCQTRDVTTDRDIPWGLVTLPDGTILYARRDAHDIIRLNPATGAKTTVGSVPGVASTNGEGGLLGLEIAPTFNTDRWLYIFHTTSSDNRIVLINVTTGFTLDLSSRQVLVQGIARNKFHNGGRLRWGPRDNKLYAGTGDAQNGDNAQKLGTNYNGKVLRMNPDGSVPSDNPFPGSLIWSFGHRNIQGLAFDSQGRLWEQEFGNSKMDETNLIVKGGNYGWPRCEGTSGSCGGFRAPARTYPVAQGSCSGITIVRDVIYVACLRGSRMYRLEISGNGVTNVRQFFQGQFGRLRTVERAPDGGLWLTTSNGGDKDSTPNNTNARIMHVGLGG
ncbi:MAG TPA: PQQ-dependent sugar dehydrogenase [Kribbellaceae bacterium]|nr:PQQ-dependent sugar dehydrogenase [Kribbellaceae bacterium]